MILGQKAMDCKEKSEDIATPNEKWDVVNSVGGAMECSTVSKLFLYVYGTYFQLTPTLQSPIFDPHRAALFFSITVKIELAIPPKPNIWISNVAPHTKLFAIFVMQSHGGNIKKCDCIAQLFYVPTLRWKVRIMQYKKRRWPWWQPDHRTRFKTTHGTSSLHQLWWCNTPCHYHGKVPWPSDRPATTSAEIFHSMKIVSFLL